MISFRAVVPSTLTVESGGGNGVWHLQRLLLMSPSCLGPAESLGLLIVCGRGAIKKGKNNCVILRFRNQATIGGNQGLDRWPVVWDWPKPTRFLSDCCHEECLVGLFPPSCSPFRTAKQSLWSEASGNSERKEANGFAYAVVDLSFLLAGKHIKIHWNRLEQTRILHVWFTFKIEVKDRLQDPQVLR